jgi:anti-sigma B factor antagonist
LAESDSQKLPPGGPGNGYLLSQTAHKGNGVTLAISGEIDIANAEAFTAEVNLLLGGAGDQLTLDLQNCLFIDSTGIRALMVLAQEQRAQGRTLKLSGTAGEPLRALELSGVLDSGLFVNDR